jgi:hypothetical protein
MGLPPLHRIVQPVISPEQLSPDDERGGTEDAQGFGFAGLALESRDAGL